MPGNRLKRKLNYTQEQLDEALANISNKNMNYRQAAEVYGIPKSTLADRITGKREPVVGHHGRNPVLTKEEEIDLKNWCIEMAKRGFGQTPEQLKAMVKRILDSSGRKEELFKNNLPGKAWWYGFVGRHPDIKTAFTEKLELARAIACRPEKVKEWFKKYEECVRKFGITQPSQIYNCDESGFPLQNKAGGKVC